MKALKETELGQDYVDSKMGRIDQACQRYGLGRNTMRKFAAEAGAVVKIGKCCLFNFSILDDYVDHISRKGI